MVMLSHDEIDVGTPFYAAARKPARPDMGIPGDVGAGPPALHKFDQPDFVRRFLTDAAESAQTKLAPASLLPPLNPYDPSSPPGNFDVDTLDLWSKSERTRFRKLFQPMHFRFYLAACELRCLVPGLPPPSRGKIKKVELVVRRVELNELLEAAKREWAWIDIPAPSVFPDPVPEAIRQMAPKVTGNSRIWWPLPDRQQSLEGEQRFPMSPATGQGLADHAIYFAFVPLASGEMYGPLRTDRGPLPAQRPEDYRGMDTETWENKAEPKPEPVLVPGTKETEPAHPLVPAPSNFALRPATIASFRALGMSWRAFVGRLMGRVSLDGPRPKFEPPVLGSNPTLPNPGAWAYVLRCVATIEHAPGCVVEYWGPPTHPAVIAPQFDPFGGRPTRIEVPSIRALAQLIPVGADPHAAGALNFSINSGLNVPKAAAFGDLTIEERPDAGGLNPCFFGIPLITICAYFMFMLALFIVLPVLSFLLVLKFCLGKK
jgi:hypothetical protein